MLREEFIASIIERQGLDYLKNNTIEPCTCGNNACPGWKMVPVIDMQFGGSPKDFLKKFEIPEGIIRSATEVRNIREERGRQAKNPEHKSVLLEAEALIHGDRAKDYGDVRVNFTNWRDMARGTGRPNLKFITAEDLAVLMVCLKVCRDSVTPKRDNPVDGAAYFDILNQVRGL